MKIIRNIEMNPPEIVPFFNPAVGFKLYVGDKISQLTKNFFKAEILRRPIFYSIYLK